MIGNGQSQGLIDAIFDQSMLRRVMETLGATVRVEIEYKKSPELFPAAEKKVSYGIKKQAHGPAHEA